MAISGIGRLRYAKGSPEMRDQERSDEELMLKRQVESLAAAKTMAEIEKYAAEMEKYKREAEAEDRVGKLLFGGGGSMPSSAGINQGADPNENFDPYTGQPNPTRKVSLPTRPIPKSFKYGGMDFANPEYANYELEQKRLEESQKPLSETSASKLSAAQQSIGNLKRVREMATPDEFGRLKSGFSKVRLGNRLGVTNPESPMGNFLNFASMGLAKLPFKTDEAQKEFENNLSTLVEGQLRARTGAAAPQSEIDREVSRILSSDDSLKSFLSKLSNAEKFVVGIAEGIRPGSSKISGPPSAVPAWVPNGFDYVGARKAGYSDDDIKAVFTSR